MNLSIKLGHQAFKVPFQVALFGLGVLVIGGGVWIFFHAHLLTVQHISCHLADQPCPDFLEAEWSKYLGRSLFFTDFQSEGERIMSSMPALTQFHFHKQLPDSLVVSFEIAPAAYQLQTPDNQYLVIDQSGMVNMISSQSAQLPTVQVADHTLPELTVHQAIDPQLHQQLTRIMEYLQVNHIQYTQLNLVSKDEIDITLENGWRVRLPTTDTVTSGQKLSVLLQSVQTNPLKQPIHVVDLRFKYPILQ